MVTRVQTKVWLPERAQICIFASHLDRRGGLLGGGSIRRGIQTGGAWSWPLITIKYLVSEYMELFLRRQFGTETI